MVRAALEQALVRGLETLKAWGAQPGPRTRPLDTREVVTFTELGLDRYEAERPDEHSACRAGDARFMP